MLHERNPNRFAAGKGTAFVIDIGQAVASVTPVVDGFVLRKGTFRHHVGHSSSNVDCLTCLTRHGEVQFTPSHSSTCQAHSHVSWKTSPDSTASTPTDRAKRGATQLVNSYELVANTLI